MAVFYTQNAGLALFYTDYESIDRLPTLPGYDGTGVLMDNHIRSRKTP